MIGMNQMPVLDNVSLDNVSLNNKSMRFRTLEIESQNRNTEGFINGPAERASPARLSVQEERGLN
jgi:hypothetical protein